MKIKCGLFSGPASALLLSFFSPPPPPPPLSAPPPAPPLPPPPPRLYHVQLPASGPSLRVLGLWHRRGSRRRKRNEGKILTRWTPSFLSWLLSPSAWFTGRGSSCHLLLPAEGTLQQWAYLPTGCFASLAPGILVRQLLPANLALAALAALLGSPRPLRAGPWLYVPHPPSQPQGLWDTPACP